MSEYNIKQQEYIDARRFRKVFTWMTFGSVYAAVGTPLLPDFFQRPNHLPANFGSFLHEFSFNLWWGVITVASLGLTAWALKDEANAKEVADDAWKDIIDQNNARWGSLR